MSDVSNSYEMVSNAYLFDFGEGAKYELRFLSDSKLDVTVVEDANYPAGTLNHFDIEITPIRDHVYMVTWVEKDTGNTVTHVEDFANAVVWTNITDIASKGFWRLKGAIIPR